MEEDNKIVHLFKEEKDQEKSIMTLITNVMDTDMDELVILGLKDGEIYYGSSSYESKLKMMGAIEILKYYIFTQEEENAKI